MTARGDTTIRTHVTFHGAERYLEGDADLDDAAEAGGGILRLVGRRLERFGLEVDQLEDEIEVGAGDETWRVSATHRGDDWHLCVSDADGPSEDPQPTAGLAMLVERIDGILKRLGGIRRIAWHTTEDWSAGEEEGGTSRPVSEPAGPPRPARVRRRPAAMTESAHDLEP